MLLNRIPDCALGTGGILSLDIALSAVSQETFETHHLLC